MKNLFEDKATKYIYSRTSSIFASNPSFVYIPENIDDLKNIIKFAKENKETIIVRGAGTSRSGQDLNDGIVVLMKNFNKIISFDEKNLILCTEPFVTRKEINDYLKQFSMFFPPDPSSGDYCTIGGMVSNNSGGAAGLKYGVTRDYLESVEIILNDGVVYQLDKHTNDDKFKKIKNYLLNNKEKTEKYYPKSTKNSTGYNLKDIFDENYINLHKIIASSEGTLGIITKIYIKVIPVLKFIEKIALKFDNIEKVIETVNKIRLLNVEKIELLDKDIIKIANVKDVFFDKILNEQFKYLLLITISENDNKTIDEKINIITDNFNSHLLTNYSKEDFDKLFNLRHSAASYINKKREFKKPLPIVEDIQIDFNKFGLFVDEIKKILNKYNTEFFMFGHIGDGNIHINTFIDFFDKKDVVKAKNILNEVSHFVISINGNLSGEHGDGKLRSQYLYLIYPELYEIFKYIKDFFDKERVFNKNNIIIDEKIDYFDNLKYKISQNTNDDTIFKENYYLKEILSCSGCGKCRIFCPSYLGTKDEKNLTRSRINLITGLINKDLNINDLIGNSSIESCLNCSLCRTNCPASTDMSKLIPQLKKEINETKILSNVVKENDKLLNLLKIFKPITNKLLTNKFIKTINHNLFSISKNITLPKIENENIDKYICDVDSINENDIVYFSGCFANYFANKNELIPAIKTLEYFGFNVKILKFKCCQISKISAGIYNIDDINFNIEIIKKLNKKNIKIITTSPSCNHAIVDLYPHIANESKETFNNIIDIFSFIKSEIICRDKALPCEINIKRDKAVPCLYGNNNNEYSYHSPCHSNQKTDDDIIFVLNYFGINVKKLEKQCCGLGGFHGIDKNNEKISKETGKKLFNEIIFEKKIVLTECGTCQLQISNNTNQKSIHPIKILYEIIKEE